MVTKTNIRASVKDISLRIISAIVFIATFVFVVTDGCIWAFGASRSIQYAFNAVAILGIFPVILYITGIISPEE